MKTLKTITALLISFLLLTACASGNPNSTKPDFTNIPQNSAAQNLPESSSPNSQTSAPPITQSSATDGYKAIWISYLEWAFFDTSSEVAFTKNVAEIYDNCVAMGLNTVIVQVRPFSDAIYKSSLFPWSHLITGVQGQEPSYDPLSIFIKEARARGLKIEAWINPYRIRLNNNMPKGDLASTNPGVTSSSLVKSAGEGLYFNPSSAEAQKLILDGVRELATNYDIDGIQFDDYFYPTTDESFDAEDYNASGTKLSLADWRRENVNTLIKATYSTIKSINPDLVFGISPQGNNDNNYNQQYSDVALWLSTSGYVDYIMPQLYWGYNYLTKSGRTDYQFAKLCNDFAALPRHSSVKLYIGLGAWRIGSGDNGSNDQSEWQTGRNLANMISTTKDVHGISGFALYDYKSLFHSESFSEIANSEVSAISQVNAL